MRRWRNSLFGKTDKVGQDYTLKLAKIQNHSFAPELVSLQFTSKMDFAFTLQFVLKNNSYSCTHVKLYELYYYHPALRSLQSAE